MSNLKTKQNPNHIKKRKKTKYKNTQKSVDNAFILLSSFYTKVQWHFLSSECKDSIT